MGKRVFDRNIMVVGGYCISASENYRCFNGSTKFGLVRKESGFTSMDVNDSIVDNEGSDESKEIRERLSEAQRLWLRELYRGYLGNL